MSAEWRQPGPSPKVRVLYSVQFQPAGELGAKQVSPESYESLPEVIGQFLEGNAEEVVREGMGR